MSEAVLSCAAVLSHHCESSHGTSTFLNEAIFSVAAAGVVLATTCETVALRSTLAGQQSQRKWPTSVVVANWTAPTL
jgi:hypothetical protein